MNIRENVLEAFKAIRDNKLRTGLTVGIIALGIMALVGILTAIDGMRASIVTNLSELGASSFDVKAIDEGRRSRRRGASQRVYPRVNYREALEFKKRFKQSAVMTLYTNASFGVEVKHGSEKTNPNILVVGTDEYYLNCKGLRLSDGRNFSATGVRSGANEAIIGHEVAQQLFGSRKALDKDIRFKGKKYKVIGVIDKRGGFGGNTSGDRVILVPLINAQTFGGSENMRYEITVMVKDPERLRFMMGEATGLMRLIRKDRLGEPNSFEVSNSESLATSIEETSDQLRIGGFAISFITLLGASIGLMNIMLVSVTERTREIGVRKSVGAKTYDIGGQFLMEAVTICQVGGLIGIILGLMIGNVVSGIIGETTFVIPWLWIGVAFIICIFVGVFSGFYPAWKASRLDPIESLRFE